MKTTSGCNRLARGICLAFITLFPAASLLAENLDNKGREFLLGFLPNFDATGSCQLHLTADAPTTVSVEYPVGSLLGTYPVSSGTVTIVNLPVNVSANWVADSVQANVVRASADNEFVCYLTNIRTTSSDAALGLPVDTMNTEYIVIDYNPMFGRGADFCVVAAYDNTTVTITPARDLIGHAAMVPFAVSLNRGEAYFGQSSNNSAPGNTGTFITADRPVGVTNGDACTQVPSGYTACDHIFEVAQPTQTWGKMVPVVNLPNRQATMYRVVASQDGTSVSLDGVVIGTINRGQFIEQIIGGNHVYEADKPIYVCQFMTGQDYGGEGVGDPAQSNMIPAAQYLTAYTFSTVGGAQFAQHYLTIVADAADAAAGNVQLDGVSVPAGSFANIGTSSWSAAVLPLTEGTHVTASTVPHGITVEGYNGYDSYIYPGGALFQFINPVGDAAAPVCTVTAQTQTSATGNSTDNRPSEDVNNNGILDPGEDLNGNGQIDKDTGIFFVALDAGAVNLTLTVDPFIPGDGAVNWAVTLTDPNLPGSGAVTTTDGAGNSCSQTLQFTVGQQPLLTVYKFYDRNTDGVWGADEPEVPNWLVGTADAADVKQIGLTPFEVELEAGTYRVWEYFPEGCGKWVPTTAPCTSLELSGDTTVSFGNVCLGSGGGKTLGFWSNKNGQKLIGADDGALLVALNLRNANGTHFNPVSARQFGDWLLSANAVNMAYMLSAQLAAMELNAFNGMVNPDALIYAPGTASANPAGFATVGAVMSEANALLGAAGLIPANSSSRAIATNLKDALDRANNGTTFVQAEPCAFRFTQD